MLFACLPFSFRREECNMSWYLFAFPPEACCCLSNRSTAIATHHTCVVATKANQSCVTPSALPCHKYMPNFLEGNQASAIQLPYPPPMLPRRSTYRGSARICMYAPSSTRSPPHRLPASCWRYCTDAMSDGFVVYHGAHFLQQQRQGLEALG
jgi:hypothetical protein